MPAVVMALLVGILTGCAGFPLVAGAEVGISGAAATRSDAVQGEVLVKFRPEAADAVHRAVATGQLTTGIGALDEIFVRIRVKQIEPLFPDMPDADALAAQYPERAKRASKPADPVDLGAIYKVSFDAAESVDHAIAALESTGLVEYAEPNHVVHAMPEMTLP